MDDPLNQAKAKATATYDAAADHFDDEPLAFWERIGRRTIERLGLPAGAKVLDVGCGTGASVLPAAQAVGPSGSVIGVDLSARLLDRARAKAGTLGLSHADFRLADMTALADGDFDAVVSVFSVFFVPNMEGLVRELWRMVRPGGKLAITTWGPRIFEPAYSRSSSRSGQISTVPSIRGIGSPMSSRYDIYSGMMEQLNRRHWRKWISSAAHAGRLVDHRSWIGTALGNRRDGTESGRAHASRQRQLAAREQNRPP